MLWISFLDNWFIGYQFYVIEGALSPFLEDALLVVVLDLLVDYAFCELKVEFTILLDLQGLLKLRIFPHLQDFYVALVSCPVVDYEEEEGRDVILEEGDVTNFLVRSLRK